MRRTAGFAAGHSFSKRLLARWLILTLLLLLCSCTETPPQYPRLQVPAGVLDSASAIAAGRSYFASHCASCHGTLAEGRSERADFFQPPAPDFRSPDYRRLDPAYLYWRIRLGKTVEPYYSRGSVMPAWGMHLSEQEIWQLVAYLRSRSDGRMR